MKISTLLLILLSTCFLNAQESLLVDEQFDDNTNGWKLKGEKTS